MKRLDLSVALLNLMGPNKISDRVLRRNQAACVALDLIDAGAPTQMLMRMLSCLRVYWLSPPTCVIVQYF